MSNDTEQYNINAIRELLLAAFTADDLHRLFLYSSNPVLRPLADEFSPKDGLSSMADRTIIYCRKRAILDDLLAEVEQANPRQFEYFKQNLGLPSSRTSMGERARFLLATKGSSYFVLGVVALCTIVILVAGVAGVTGGLEGIRLWQLLTPEPTVAVKPATPYPEPTDTQVLIPTPSSTLVLSPPTLYPIDNTDIDGSYLVGWSSVSTALSYVLEESMEDGTTKPRKVYSGPDTYYPVDGKDAGHYCYHVKACDSLSCSGRSNAQCVDPWWEYEDNSTCQHANGPLISGTEYQGHHDWRDWDCFWIDLRSDGQLRAELTTEMDHDLQLHLIDQSCSLTCYDSAPPYELGGPECTASKGRNHVCIHTLYPSVGEEYYVLSVWHP